MAKVTIAVRGMTCNHCKMSVEKAINLLNGVSGVEVNLATGNVSVEYDPSRAGPGTIKEAIRQAGYEA